MSSLLYKPTHKIRELFATVIDTTISGLSTACIEFYKKSKSYIDARKLDSLVYRRDRDR
jgi:hypothetical protein